MSHPDYNYDFDNSFDDDNYDDYHDFYDESVDDYYDDSMDGDHESGLASAGWGLDESYDPSCDHDEFDYGGDW